MRLLDGSSEDVGSALAEWDRVPEVAFDTETTGLNPWKGAEVALVSMAAPDGRTLLVRVHDHMPPVLLRFLETRDLLIGHNVVGFDALFMALAGMDVFRARWYDTMVAEQSILPQGRRDYAANLADTLERRFKTNRAARKKSGEGLHSWTTPELTPEQLSYAENDVLHLHALRTEQLAKGAAMAEKYAGRHPVETEMAVVPAVIAMKLNGLPFDRAIWASLFEEHKAKTVDLEGQIFDALGHSLNLRSPAQLKLAMSTAGLEVQDTKWETLRDLELRGVEGLPELIIHWKASDQFLKMYREEWVAAHVAPDGRVHSTFWQLGTDTGRFSSKEPNLQQVTKWARRMFGAPPGWVIVSADYSQIEVRLAAAQAHDIVMLQALEHEDVHSAIAAQMFECPVEIVSKDQRKLAKACVFTLLFGGSAERLYDYTRLAGGSLELDEARHLVAKFFGTYTGIARAKAVAYGLSRRMAVSVPLPTGIVRVMTRGQGLTPQTVLNTTVQGAAAAGLKFALSMCVKAGLAPFLCATIHDEIICCCPEGDATWVAGILEQCMLDGMAEITDARVAVEVGITRQLSGDAVTAPSPVA